MIEIALGEPRNTKALPLELRTTRGSLAPSADVPRLLAERIVLGAADPVRLSPDSAFGDDQLRAFLASQDDRVAYWLVAFTCTFDHDDELPFATSWIQLELVADSGEAIARSLEPMILRDDAPPLSWNVRVTFPCVIQPEVGVVGDVSRERLFCEGSYEGTATPAWRYFRTRRKPIRGQQRMSVVIRTERAGTVGCAVRAGATAERKRFVGAPLSYSTPPKQPKPWFTLPAGRL